MFSPRVNLTRIDEESIADIVPPMEFENLNMENNEANQAFTRSQGSTGVDLNNVVPNLPTLYCICCNLFGALVKSHP